MTPSPITDLAIAIRLADVEARLAERDARLARLEARVAGEPEDDALGIAAAARLIGYSVSNLRKLVRSDPALAACYWRAPGKSSRLIFSRQKLERWKAAHS